MNQKKAQCGLLGCKALGANQINAAASLTSPTSTIALISDVKQIFQKVTRFLHH
jgi:hypothetical protein